MIKAEPSSIATPQTLTENYRADASAYDEMCSASGEIRPHWQAVVAELDDMGAAELSRRSDEVQRLLQENGVTYNVYDDSRSPQRSWVVDPIPLVIGKEEWATIEAGIAQRARLLNMLLADLYGSRSVIRLGLLPPELIYAHPGFQHACVSALLPDQRWLVFHGVDLARAADGSIRAIGDRAQSPAGVGYALENRIALARAFPGLYRDAPLRRLAGFLDAKRASLASLALHNREHPHVVLLTPGPGNKSYFEHAYLANYLSFNLMEGQDLVVRSGRVWLKTLGGLRAVDVILRRVDDAWCDPLELRGDSLLGVPGLLQAVRCGGVAIANALGSGIIENPGLMAFLPALCRHFLGENLKLPSLPTWWCGDPASRNHVLAHLDQLVVRSILPDQTALRGHSTRGPERAKLSAQIQATPHLFIGQEPLNPSTAPIFVEGRLVPRPVTWRSFALANAAGYRVMPGGLAHILASDNAHQVSVQRGGIGKDLWVLAAAPERHVSLLRQAYGPIVVTRDGSDLPSRVADNLYWLGRYSERFDGKARLLQETLAKLLELQDRERLANNCLEDLLTALEVTLPSHQDPLRSRFFDIRRELLQLLTDPSCSGSLPHIFASMFRNGRAVRDHLGDDSWRLLNLLQRDIQEIPGNITARVARARLTGQLTLLAAFSGLNNETIPHHYGWLFLDIGRQLERVLFTLSLFKLAFVSATSPGVPLWEVVLTTTDNLTAYRRRYRSALYPKAIMDLLLFDEGNPRSIGYQLRRIQRQIDRLPHSESTPYRSAEERLILQAVSSLQLVNIETLEALEPDAPCNLALIRLLDALYQPLSKLSDALTHSHFSHAEVPRQLITM